MPDQVLLASISGVLSDVGRSLREAFFMFWETLWPLVLGFGLSGAVQAFVSPQDMERALGDHRPRTVCTGERVRDGLVVLLLRGRCDGEVPFPTGS